MFTCSCHVVMAQICVPMNHSSVCTVMLTVAVGKKGEKGRNIYDLKVCGSFLPCSVLSADCAVTRCLPVCLSVCHM